MKWSLLLAGLMLSANVWAHGPTPQKTDESIQVNAAADAIWKKVSAACGLAQWHPQVAACEAVNDKQQKITLKNGKHLLQEIDEVSEADMTVSYRLSGDIDLEALPVSSLNGKIKVSADGANAKVVWTARYYRAFTGNEPPEGQDDESAKNAVDAFVKEGLQGLKDGRQNAASNSTGWRKKICVAMRPLFQQLGMSTCA